MASSSALTPLAPATSAAATMRALIELTKPGITKLVLVTTSVGFALAALPKSWSWGALAIAAIGCLIGTGLSASSANALNQWWERRRDALMPRTCARPLPTDRLTPRTAVSFGVLCGALGVATLALFVTYASAAVALATILIYVFLYTPIKPMTTTSTIVGAIPGALPPVIGWAAVSTDPGGWASLTEPAAWSLFAIMFVWQIPHFLAIAWMHKEGYALGGFRVLPVVDPDGQRTARATIYWLIALVPISLSPILLMPGRLGWGYALVAVALGIFFIKPAIRFSIRRDRPSARRVFFASIIYLPLLLGAMVVDAIVTTFLL